MRMHTELLSENLKARDHAETITEWILEK